jgi:hypothetical protein
LVKETPNTLKLAIETMVNKAIARQKVLLPRSLNAWTESSMYGGTQRSLLSHLMF